MTWSGKLLDNAKYRSGKHPTCTPGTVSSGTHFSESSIFVELHLGIPSAKLRNRAHVSHIISNISFCLAILDNLSPTGSPLRKTYVVVIKEKHANNINAVRTGLKLRQDHLPKFICGCRRTIQNIRDFHIPI